MLSENGSFSEESYKSEANFTCRWLISSSNASPTLTGVLAPSLLTCINISVPLFDLYLEYKSESHRASAPSPPGQTLFVAQSFPVWGGESGSPAATTSCLWQLRGLWSLLFPLRICSNFEILNGGQMTVCEGTRPSDVLPASTVCWGGRSEERWAAWSLPACPPTPAPETSTLLPPRLHAASWAGSVCPRAHSEHCGLPLTVHPPPDTCRGLCSRASQTESSKGAPLEAPLRCPRGPRGKARRALLGGLQCVEDAPRSHIQLTRSLLRP